MPKTLMFDLDGTLVDSVPDLLASCNRVMAARTLAPFSAAEITAMVGDGAAALVERIMRARGRDATADDLQEFLTDYMAHVADATRPYPGVPETLQALAAAGWTLAVVTNKPEAAARAVLDHLGLMHNFAALAGGDTHPVRKPDPGHLLLTLGSIGATAAEAVMVGDHHNDLAAASAAGIPSIFAAWGYGHDTGADAAAATVCALPGLAAQLIEHAGPT